jgi:hypothetical protein
MSSVAGDDEQWVIDDDFVESARYTEASADVRAERARRVAAGHDALRAAGSAPPRRRRRRFGSAAVLLLAVVGLVALLAVPGAREWVQVQGTAPDSLLPSWAEPDVQLEQPDGSLVAVPPRPTDAQDTPLGVAPAVPEGQGGYAFAATRDGSEPVSFDPCRPVHVVLNLALAPPDAQDQLARALAVVTEATGLRFVVDGGTDEPPGTDRPLVQPDRYGERWAPVLVAWTTPQDVPELDGETLGIGGAASYQSGDADSVRYVSGVVYLDAAQLAAVPDELRSEVSHVLLLHELGHLVGLDHVSDPSQLMYDEMVEGVTAFGEGDRRGLALLGQGDCFSDA